MVLSKRTSEIEDLTRLSAQELAKIQLRASPERDAHKHLSLWEVSGSDKGGAAARAVPVWEPKTSEWVAASATSAYILLIVRGMGGREPAERDEPRHWLCFPPAMQRLIESLALLAPTDLALPFGHSAAGDFAFRLYNLVGRQCGKEARALSVVKATELEAWLGKRAPNACAFVYAGFYIAQEKVKFGARAAPPAGWELRAEQGHAAESYRFLWELAQDAAWERPGLEAVDPQFLIDLFLDADEEGSTSPSKGRSSAGQKFALDLASLNCNSFDEPAGDSGQRETNRKLAKLREFEADCSNVWAERLFVSGYRVACDADRLAAAGITHVINCAGDYCANEHSPRFVYQTFFIKDSKVENIECIFYEAIEFIERALAGGGRVLVHCMQGVSRSVTVALAFLIFRLRAPYAQAFELAREGRGIASPNIGFISQLMAFERRVLEPAEAQALPKVFAAGSHQVEDARRIVFRLIADVHFYKAGAGRGSVGSGLSSKKVRLQERLRGARAEATPRKEGRLDPRSVFLVCGRDACFAWVGAQTCRNALPAYLARAEEYAARLRRFEHAPPALVRAEQGAEPAAFWQLFGLGERPAEPYAVCAKWSGWFINFEDESRIRSARSYKSRLAYAEHEVIKDKPAMFIFPFHLEPLYVLDLDDLREECLAVLCDRGRNVAHVWQGSLFRPAPPPEPGVREFIDAVLLSFFEREETGSVAELWQMAGEECDEFFDYFR